MVSLSEQTNCTFSIFNVNTECSPFRECLGLALLRPALANVRTDLSKLEIQQSTPVMAQRCSWYSTEAFSNLKYKLKQVLFFKITQMHLFVKKLMVRE